MNIKIIILLLGIFMTILGIKNMYNTKIEKKYIYKFIPRNVYDEIYLSLPLAQYDEKLYDSINPDFILDDEFDYNSLSKITRSTDMMYDELNK